VNNYNNNNNNYNQNNESLSQKVIDNSDIVSIISEYIALEKKGNDYKGLCPFHNDGNPSLSVSPSRKVFKCFSCNTAGNVITFVQKIENISFLDALKKVASKSGIKLDIKKNAYAERNEKYYKIMNDSTNTYEFFLKNTDEGKKALEYLYNRNINDDIIRKFRIGLSAHEDNILTKVFIDQNKYLPIDLKELGLVSEDGNKYKDLFHGRIMFPITDLKGNIIAFSGRVYDKKSDSKYINSRENLIFKKKDVLYNYYNALNEIKLKDHVYIFEGFMDVIAAYRAGINNAIATMGTALTESHINIISSVTKNITLCYDGDNPGIEATKKAIKLFENKNISVNTITLPNGLDPDDYINKFGSESFVDLFTNKRVSSYDYLYEIAKRNLDKTKPNSIVSFQRNVYEIINGCNNKAISAYLMNKMSSDLEVTVDDLENDYKKFVPEEPVYINNAHNTNNAYNINNINVYDIPDNDIYNLGGYNDINIPDIVPIDYPYINPNNSFDNTKKINKQNKQSDSYLEAEKGIIYLSFYNRNVCLDVKRRLPADEFISAINRNILFALYEYYDLAKEMDKEEFLKTLEPIEIETLNTIINTCTFYSIKCLDDFIESVKLSNEYKQDKRLREKMQSCTDGDEYTKYLEEFIKNKKKLIKAKKKTEE